MKTGAGKKKERGALNNKPEAGVTEGERWRRLLGEGLRNGEQEM